MKKWIVCLLVFSNFVFGSKVDMYYKPGPLLPSDLMVNLVDAFDVRDLVEASDTSLKTAHRGTKYFYKVYKSIEHKSIYHHEVNKNWNNRFLKLVLGKPENALPPVLLRVFGSRMLISLNVIEAGNKRQNSELSTFEKMIRAIRELPLTSPVFLIHNFSQLDGKDFMSKADLYASFPEDYIWKVLGNSLLVYPKKYQRVETSELVNAVSTSYFHQEKGIEPSELKEAEYYIRLADTSIFADMATHLARSSKRRKTLESYYYHFWHGLSLLGKGNNKAALDEFKICESADFTHPLLAGYIEECLDASY